MLIKKFLLIFLLFSPLIIKGQTFDLSFDDFGSLYNQYRIAVPDNIPWAGSYWSYRNDGIATQKVRGQEGTSPAQRYDRFFSRDGSRAHSWEINNHSCRKFFPSKFNRNSANIEDVNKYCKEGPSSQDKRTCETLVSCYGWWGHCNAWAAAAIKEPEPRQSINVNWSGKRETFTVADQKALLTEVYMSTASLFYGNTDKSKKTGAWVNNSRDPSYGKFWDVTPRAFFLIFTNYVGARKTGVIIDRFTGDEVWNQPIVGYRILPIGRNDIHAPENRNGETVYPVTIRFKMFWAEDGVGGEEISEGFRIDATNDSPQITSRYNKKNRGKSRHYSGRYVQFKLFFDSPLQMDGSGTKVQSAGEIVGDGIWYHQERPSQFYYNTGGDKKYLGLNETHPDFIWLPTNFVRDTREYKNPHVRVDRVKDVILKGRPPEVAPKEPVNVTMLVENFANRNATSEEMSSGEKNKITNKFSQVLKRARIDGSVFGVRRAGADMVEVGLRIMDQKQLNNAVRALKNDRINLEVLADVEYGDSYYPPPQPTSTAGGGNRPRPTVDRVPTTCRKAAARAGLNKNVTNRLCRANPKSTGAVNCLVTARRRRLPQGIPMRLCQNSTTPRVIGCFKAAKRRLGFNNNQAVNLCKKNGSKRIVRCIRVNENLGVRRNQAKSKCINSGGNYRYRMAGSEINIGDEYEEARALVADVATGAVIGTNLGRVIGGAIAHGRGGNTREGEAIGAIAGVAIGALAGAGANALADDIERTRREDAERRRREEEFNRRNPVLRAGDLSPGIQEALNRAKKISRLALHIDKKLHTPTLFLSIHSRKPILRRLHNLRRINDRVIDHLRRGMEVSNKDRDFIAKHFNKADRVFKKKLRTKWKNRVMREWNSLRRNVSRL